RNPAAVPVVADLGVKVDRAAETRALRGEGFGAEQETDLALACRARFEQRDKSIECAVPGDEKDVARAFDILLDDLFDFGRFFVVREAFWRWPRVRIGQRLRGSNGRGPGNERKLFAG